MATLDEIVDQMARERESRSQSPIPQTSPAQPLPDQPRRGKTLDEIVDEMAREQSGTVPLGVGNAGGSPDEAAEAFRLGNKQGVPPTAVEGQVKEVREQLWESEAAAAIGGNSKISNYIASNVMAPKVSADDYPALQRWSTVASPATVGMLKHTVEGAQQNYQVVQTEIEGLAPEVNAVLGWLGPAQYRAPAKDVEETWANNLYGDVAALNQRGFNPFPQSPLLQRLRAYLPDATIQPTIHGPLPTVPAAEGPPGALARGAVTGFMQSNPEMLAEFSEMLENIAPPELKPGAAELQKRFRNAAKLSPEEFATRAPRMFDIENIDQLGAFAGEVIGQGIASSTVPMATGLAGAAGGALIGGPTGGLVGAAGGAFLGSYALNTGEVYKALKDAGVDKAQATNVAIKAGAAMAVLDTINPALWVANLAGLRAARAEIIKSIVRRVLTEVAKGGGREAITEAMQEGIKEGAVSVAAEKPFLTIETGKKVAEAAVAGGLTGGVLGPMGTPRNPKQPELETVPVLRPEIIKALREGKLPQPGIDPVIDKFHVAQRAVDEAQLDREIDAAEEVKTKERAAELFSEFVREHKGGFYEVSAEIVSDLYKAAQKTPEPGDDLLGFIPNLSEQVKQGLAGGTDVRIPIVQYLGHVDKSLHEKLKEHLRLREDGLTAEEAKELGATKPEDYMVENTADEDVIGHIYNLFPEAFAEADLRSQLRPVPPTPPVEAAPIEGEPSLAPMREGAEVTEVRITTDEERMLEMLGSKLYGTPDELASVSVKELLQNSFDAIKGLIDALIVPQGAIDIKVDKNTRTITIKDDGSGMSRNIFASKFFQIGGTHKTTDRPSGSFGIAKMLFLFENQNLHIVTMQDGMVTELRTTGPDLKETVGMGKPVALSPSRPANSQDFKLFPKGHGTYIRITVPHNYIDPSDGESRNIKMSDQEWDYDVLTESPLFSNIEVKFNNAVLPIGANFPVDKYAPLAGIKFRWGAVRIYVSKEQEPGHWSNVRVLSNGIWQFNQRLLPFGKLSGDPIPRLFYFDIIPAVKATQVGYPFELNRQGFTKAVEKDMAAVNGWLQRLFYEESTAQEAKNFGTFEYLGPAGPQAVTLQLPDLPRLAPLQRITPQTKIEVVEGQLLIDGQPVPELTPEEVRKIEVVQRGEVSVPQGTIDPQTPMLHDNIRVKKDFEPVGDPDLQQRPYYSKWATLPPLRADEVPLSVRARERFGQRYDDFNQRIGASFIQLRNTVVGLLQGRQVPGIGTLDYSDLLAEGVGVSYDLEYRGVSIVVPFQGLFVNPALTVFREPAEAAVGMIGTMIHELAHYKVRNHDAAFPAEMQLIQIALDAAKIRRDNRFDIEDFKRQMVEFFEVNHDILGWLQSAVAGGTPLGERLRDASEQQARDEGAPGDLGRPRDDRLGRAVEGVGEEPGPPKFPEEVRKGGIGAAVAQGVRRQKKSLFLEPLFSEPPQGVDAVSWGRYSRLIQQQTQALFDKIVAAATKTVRREQTAQWKRDEARTQAEVETDLKSRPDFVADRYLRYGILPTGQKIARFKLDAQIVQDMLGPNHNLQDLTQKRGAFPNDVAPFVNFSSGAEMLQVLQQMNEDRAQTGETPRQYFDRTVREETKRRMAEKHGSLEENITSAALDIALEELTVDIISEELAILAQLAGQDFPFSKTQMKDLALENFGNARIGSIQDWRTMERAVQSTALNLKKAMLKQDWAEALKWEQRRLLAITGAREFKAFQQQYKAFERMVEQINNPQAIQRMDPEAVQQMRAVLQQAGLATGARPATTIIEWGQTYYGLGYHLEIPEWVSKNEQKPLNEMTVDEWRDYNRGLQTMQKVARNLQQVWKAGKRASFEATRSEMLQQLYQRGLKAEKEKGIGWIRSWVDRENVRMESMLRDFDLQDPLGVFSSTVFRPIKEAGHLETKMLKEFAEKIKALPGDKPWRASLEQEIDQNFFMDPRYDQEGAPSTVPFRLNKADLLQIALYYGNRSNIRKFAIGYVGKDKAPVLEVQMKALLDKHLSKMDWDYVQAVWDLFASLQPRILEHERRLGNADPEIIEPEAVLTPHGGYRGGYFPVTYDKLRSKIEQVKVSGPFESDYRPGATPRGYIKARTEYYDKVTVKSSPEIIGMRLQQTIHDIAFREAVQNAWRILNDPQIRAGIDNYYGAKYSAQTLAWLKRVANQYNINDMALESTNEFLRKTRTNLTFAALGFNLPVILASDIGWPHPLVMVNMFFRSAEETESLRQQAMSKSQELQDLELKYQAELTEIFLDLQNRRGWNEFQRKWAEWGFLGTLKINKQFRIATWIHEYQKAIAEDLSEADAIYRADSLTRKRHGSARIEDLPSSLTGSESSRIFMLFMSFFNTMYQTARDIPSQTAQGHYLDAMQSAMISMFIPALLGAFLFGNWDDDEPYWWKIGKAFLAAPLSLHWVGAAIVSQVFQNRESRSPYVSLIKETYTLGEAAFKLVTRRPTDAPIIRLAIAVPGTMAGIAGSIQIARGTQFWVDVYNRRQNPRTFMEYVKGTVWGKFEERR